MGRSMLAAGASDASDVHVYSFTRGDDHVVEGPVPRQQLGPTAAALVVVDHQRGHAAVDFGEVVREIVGVGVIVVDQERA